MRSFYHERQYGRISRCSRFVLRRLPRRRTFKPLSPPRSLVFMPAGDASRTWFPELVDMLQSAWNEAMSMDQLIELTGQLTTRIQTLRNERNIKPEMMWCPKCQTRHRAAPPQVSVRATNSHLIQSQISRDQQQGENHHQHQASAAGRFLEE